MLNANITGHQDTVHYAETKLFNTLLPSKKLSFIYSAKEFTSTENS
jgi:hypothetical protein